ncbi:MAG TPA: dolichyl-phosphate beta-glucosyltransferase [Candidatus Norongarragalinales archaeon]|jgi:glycosyltransferase involved in cell wall biosynthesis|nr:dolichyl-phosphate beta-glucosyltransferase [Candidatus Norongarragalinales archaeon]
MRQNNLISIIIPARNEEKRIRDTLEELEKFFKQWKQPHETIVIVNGNDATIDIVKDFAKTHRNVRFIDFKQGLGKGGAVQKGMQAAKGNPIIYDADASTPPTEIKKLHDALKNADIAIGSRNLPESKTTRPAYRDIASQAYNAFVRTLFNLPFKDTQCGFKALRKNAAKKLLPTLHVKDFAWDIELLLHARRAGMKIVEIPIEWKHKKGGTTTPALAAKMILTTIRIWRREKKLGLPN